MIRTLMITSGGPVLMLGITDENVRRLKAGMPVDIDLGPFAEGLAGRPLARVVIAHGATHMDVVDDMQRHGLPVPAQLVEQARTLDAQLASERKP